MEVPVRFPSGNIVKVEAEMTCDPFGMDGTRTLRSLCEPKDMRGWFFRKVIGYPEWIAHRSEEWAREPEAEPTIGEFKI